MDDWTSGYVADLGYTYGYYAELNPLSARLAMLTAGITPPEVAVGCELGFGQGIGVNIHAAASATTWWGTDFNPAQAAFAQQVSTAAKSKAQLFDESFEEFCARPDLPQMDYIGLHGIWSWINDQNRAVIVEFLRRKLKVGGVLYISYNTQPGWAASVPLRDLLAGHADVMGSPGQGLIARIDEAIAFAEKLIETKPGYARANPGVVERLKKIASQNRHYVAHEYFNRDWEPMSFAKMAEWLGPAKLNFACSANYLDLVDNLTLPAQQQALLKEIPDPIFRQTVRDFCVNQQFRKDYWVKGARPLNPMEQSEQLGRQLVVLTVPPSEVKLNTSAAKVDGAPSEAMHLPVLEALSDHKPKSLAELAKRLQPQGITVSQVMQSVLVLGAKAAVQPAQSPETSAAAKRVTDRLNQHLMNLARGSPELSFLASPVTGGGVQVTRFQQMFLLARARGEKTPEDWARSAWRDLSQQGQRLLKQGKPLATPEENLAELTRKAKEFADKRVKVLEALQVA